MNILITGAKGFVGKNMVENLKTIKNGHNKSRPNLIVDNIYEYDIDSPLDMLDQYCRDADFVFNFAGVNRPQFDSEFWEGNYDFSAILLDSLKKQRNKCPVVLSSSIQASLIGRYDNEYGKSKKASEELFFKYSEESGAEVFVYRFPNLFGKWCRPNYNSVVATFCYNMANDLPIVVNDRSLELNLLYIDDLVEEMLDAIEGNAHRCENNGVGAFFCGDRKYCAVPTTHNVTLGAIVDLLNAFRNQPETLVIGEIPKDSFEKKLYSTYLSYLPREKMVFDLHTKTDVRGSFTEILRTKKCGQISINVTKPGIVKGQHWHNTKWEMFIVVSGTGVIQQRRLGSKEVLNFTVSGDRLQVVQILPGYAHNIINLSDHDDLVTIMWANEFFDPACSDTYPEAVCSDEAN